MSHVQKKDIWGDNVSEFENTLTRLRHLASQGVKLKAKELGFDLVASLRERVNGKPAVTKQASQQHPIDVFYALNRRYYQSTGNATKEGPHPGPGDGFAFINSLYYKGGAK